MKRFPKILVALLVVGPAIVGVCTAQTCTVIDTGQSKCCDNRSEMAPPKAGQPFYGQDAQFPTQAPSDTLSPDGLTVHDNNTGLMWSKDDSGKGMNWQDALAWVQKKNAEKFLGHDDWRLPNVKELQSIVDYTRSPDTANWPAIDPVFNCTRITNEAGKADFPFYWSATTHAGFLGGGAAMYVAFGRGAGWKSASTTLSVLCGPR
jgi:hypothetical protein